MTYTKRFDEIGRDDLSLAGGKGANLGELSRAGLPVPPGFVVTTGAYDDFVEAGGLRDEILRLASRIAGEVLVRAELRRIDEDGRRDVVGPTFRFVDKSQVPCMERAHRRHERKRTLQFDPRPRQFFTRTNDLHAAGASGKPWTGRRLHMRRGKDQA